MYIDQSFMKIFSILTFLYPTVKGQNCNNLSCSGETCTVKFNPVVPVKVPQTKLPTKYDSKGLQPFFNLANSFMNTVQSKRFDEQFKDFDTSGLSKSEKREMIKEYEIPIGVAAGFGLLFALLMPIIGCCFCCCRCCGNCGGMMSQQPKQARQHKCCCAMGVLLLLVTIFMLCGVLFMFVTNNRLHATYDEIGPTYEEVINEAINYGNAVQEELQSIPKTQVTCISKLVEYDLGDDMVKVLVGNELKNLVSQNLTGIIALGKAESENITKIGGSLQGVNDTSNTLKLLATELNNTINSINRKIKQAEADCNASAALRSSSLCNDIGSNLVTTNIDYNQFPNVDDEFASVDGVIKKNLTAQIQEAENILNNIPTTVADKSKIQRQDINKTIDKMKETIRNSIDNITADIDRETNGRREEYMKYKKDYLDDKSKYENYRFYVYIALSSVMALIVLLMGCGLTLGTIGYRRDRSPTQRRSISNHGGNCLMAAVGFMFLFSFFFMIFCVVWFIAGIHMHIVCRDSKDAQPIDVFLASELSDSKVAISQSLKNCRENQPLYTAINGENIYNISAEFDVEKQAEGFREDASNININLDDQNVLTADAEEALNDIQDAGVDRINYTQFFNTLRTKITETNLTKLADDLALYSKTANDSGLARSLDAIIIELENLQRNTIADISTNLTKLDGEVKTLQKMTDHIVPQAQKILDGLNASNIYIQVDLKSEISQIIEKYADRMIGWLNQGTAHLINQARTNMARCKPLANIYDGAVNTFLCDNVVQNANGFWLALGWCLLFFIPAIILCVRLAKYFRRMDYEVGHEEIIDHPPFNDKIPLQNYDHHPPPPYEQSNNGYQYQ